MPQPTRDCRDANAGCSTWSSDRSRTPVVGAVLGTMLAFLCLFMLGIVGRGPVDDSTLHALHLKSDESIKDAKNDKKREPLYDSSIRALLKTRESDATGRRQRTTTKQN